jgi:hypothetical protein
LDTGKKLAQIELPRFPDQCLSELIVLFRLFFQARRMCAASQALAIAAHTACQDYRKVGTNILACANMSVSTWSLSFRISARFVTVAIDPTCTAMLRLTNEITREIYPTLTARRLRHQSCGPKIPSIHSLQRFG